MTYIEVYQKLLEVNKLNRCKIDSNKPKTFLYTSNNQSENVMRRGTSIIVTKSIKCLIKYVNIYKIYKNMKLTKDILFVTYKIIIVALARWLIWLKYSPMN